MLAPALLPELINESTLPHHAHSALPCAPVRPQPEPRRRRVLAAIARRGRVGGCPG